MSTANKSDYQEEGCPPPLTNDDGNYPTDDGDDESRMSAASSAPTTAAPDDEDYDVNRHAWSLILPSTTLLSSMMSSSSPSFMPLQGGGQVVSNVSARAGIDDESVNAPSLCDAEEAPSTSHHDDDASLRRRPVRVLPRRYGGILAVLSISFIVALLGAAAMGFASPTFVKTEELAPGEDVAPSFVGSPTISPVPSSSPTTCAKWMASEGAAKSLDLPVSRPQYVQVAVEGGHMVLVARDMGTTYVNVVFYVRRNDSGDGGDGGTTTWEKGNHYVIDYGETYSDRPDEVDPLYLRTSVALSGNSALVGFPYSHSKNDTGSGPASPGEVYVFDRIDGTEIWEKREGTLMPPNDTIASYYFGSSIDVVGDIACVVSDYSPIGWSEPKVYLFRHVDGEWSQFRRLDLNYPPTAKECFVGDEDTLAVQVDDTKVEIYKYDAFDGTYKLIQDAIVDDLMVSVSFDNDYLVYSTRKGHDCDETKGLYIYRRRESYQPYFLEQNVTVADSSACSSPVEETGERRELFHVDRTGLETSTYHDGDILVTKGDNRTDMYVKRDDGYWEWALALGVGRPYRGYHVSGRNLIAIAYNQSTEEDEVYYFDVEACEPSPTQMPSTSQVPSISSYPSPMPSITTTFGYTPIGGGIWRTNIPTEGNYRCEDPWLGELPVTPESSLSSPNCHWIDITIAFDDDPSMSWDVQRVDDSGSIELLMLSKGAPDEAYQLRNESLCVEEGVYQFTIYGEKGIRHPGFYDVRSHDGEYIARGGEFDCSETVTFSIPLTSAPTAMPSSETSVTTNTPTVPTLTPVPTPLTGPTGACTMIDITVVHDMFPYETQFDIQKINTDGEDNEVLQFFDPIADGEEGTVRKESMCLVDGTYQFTIYDTVGDGLYSPGNYNVTSEGSLILRGDSFEGFLERTMFSIPFTGSL